MKKQLDLLKCKPSKIFFSYLTNSVIGSMTVAIYILFDTIFVGQGVGSDGLAALNIAIPIFNVMNSIGMLLGVGGATSMSILKGQGEEEKAKNFFGLSCIVGLILAVIFPILSVFLIDDIIRLLGADQQIFELTKEYLQPLMYFCGIYIFNYLLQVYVRNDNDPKLPMFTGVVSGVLNIILDATFIFGFNMGMRGAVIATIISTVCGMSIMFLHFKQPNCTLVFKLPSKDFLKDLLRIVRNGLPSFVFEASLGFIIILFNNRLINLIGVDGVSAYGIIANINYIMLAVFNGTAQAIQPAISVNTGALKVKRAKEFLKLGEITCAVCGVIFACGGFLLKDHLVYLFLDNPSANVIAISSISIQIYFFTYLFDGTNIVFGMFLQAAEKSKLSTTVSVMRGIALPIVGMYLLPYLFGVNGIWGTVTFAEAITLVFSIAFVVISLKKFKQMKNTCENV